MKQLIQLLIFLFVSATTIAGDIPVIKMSEMVKAGHIVVKPSIEYQIDFTGYEVPSDTKLLVIHVLDSPKSHYYYQPLLSAEFYILRFFFRQAAHLVQGDIRQLALPIYPEAHDMSFQFYIADESAGWKAHHHWSIPGHRLFHSQGGLQEKRVHRSE